MDKNKSLYEYDPVVSRKSDSDHWTTTQKQNSPPCFAANASGCGIQIQTRTTPTSYSGGVKGIIRVPTLQELTGDVLRRQVEEERKDIIRRNSKKYESKRVELELRRKELRRQLQEVKEQTKSMEIDCHEELLTELDHFDNVIQEERLGVLTDIGQPDRICPLCEQYFSSGTDLPFCCLGPDRCYLHTMQRCCFSCLRPNLCDILQCLTLFKDSSGSKNDDGIIGGDDDEQGREQIMDDLATIEAAVATPSWMLDEIFGEGAGRIRQDNENDDNEYQNLATAIAAAAIRLVPSETGSVKCPTCRQEYCDHDFLYHLAACCSRT
mmetsp:Transcript_17203/g.37632  ORF Transcript_17203/g.37632 Transcript_17203/m.37632 type:complete len:323 (-) Transcript_17203:162-1130(-)